MVKFFEYKPNEGPEPGEVEKKLYYETWAKIDEVWSKDVEQAKANGSLSDLTITIRDTQGEYLLTNKHYIEIDMLEYKDKRYNVAQVQPDAQARDFIKIIAKLVSD